MFGWVHRLRRQGEETVDPFSIYSFSFQFKIPKSENSKLICCLLFIYNTDSCIKGLNEDVSELFCI